MCISYEALAKDRVLDAFERSGLSPVFEQFGDAVHCGCAITAVAAATFPTSQVVKMRRVLLEGEKAVRGFLEVDQSLNAFILGFDGKYMPNVPRVSQEMRRFFERGKEVREAVILRYAKQFRDEARKIHARQMMDQEDIAILFLGYELPDELTFKHQTAIPYLSKLGLHLISYEGDLVHMVPDARIAEVQEVIAAWNKQHDLSLVPNFERVSRDQLAPLMKVISKGAKAK